MSGTYIFEIVNRTIVPSATEELAVVNDNDSRYITFKIPSVIDGIDITDKILTVRYVNSLNRYDQFFCNTREVITEGNEQFVLFDWVLDSNVTSAKGTVTYDVSIYDTNDITNISQYILHTKPATFEIDEGLLDIGAPTEDENALQTAIDSFNAIAAKYYNDTLAAAKAAQASADAAAKSAASLKIDTTLTISGQAADAKTVGDRLAGKAESSEVASIRKGLQNEIDRATSIDNQLNLHLADKADAKEFNAILKTLSSKVECSDNVFDDTNYIGTKIPNLVDIERIDFYGDFKYVNLGIPYKLGLSYIDGTTASTALAWRFTYIDGTDSAVTGVGTAITPQKVIDKIVLSRTTGYKNEDLDKVIEHVWLTSNGEYTPFVLDADSKRLNNIEKDLSNAMVSTNYTDRKNLLFADNITDNLQIQPFTVVTDEKYCSAYIPIKTGESLYVNYSLGTPTAHLCDSEKRKISWVTLPFSNDGASRNVGYTVTTENIAYIRLSWLKSRVENRGSLFFSTSPIRFVEPERQFKEEYIPELSTGKFTNWWLLKNGDSLGDSLTGQGFFQSWTRRYFGLASFKNNGVGGSKLSGSDVDSKRLSMWKDERINALNANADFVTVLGGQNDGNVEIGEISKNNKDTDTYVGALNTIIDKIYARCGDDVIIILCCPFWVPAEGNDGARFVTLGNAVKAVAQLHGLPVADFGGLCMTDYNNANRYWGTDKTHPIELFYKEKIAPILINTMESIKLIDWEKVKYYTES